LARRAAGGNRLSEKSPRENRTWPMKAAEKMTFRARANYASRVIIMQKVLEKNWKRMKMFRRRDYA